MWGVTDINGKSCEVDEKRLKPLGLVCWGGGSKNGGTSYYVCNNDKSFSQHLDEKEFKNVEKIYSKFLRKHKLNKLDE